MTLSSLRSGNFLLRFLAPAALACLLATPALAVDAAKDAGQADAVDKDGDDADEAKRKAKRAARRAARKAKRDAEAAKPKDPNIVSESKQKFVFTREGGRPVEPEKPAEAEKK